MAERAITIQPGIVNPLGDTLPAGTTLYNLDTANSVWVSANPGVVPGLGTKIGAYGSVQWQGGACYAVVDKGVTAPVAMTVTDQAVAPVNPVDVASALAAKGVPSVLLGNTVFNGSVTFDVNGYWTVPTAVNQYASLLLFVNPGATGPGELTLTWEDSAGTGLVVETYTMVNGGSLLLSVAVKSDKLRLEWTAPNATMTVRVYASNRALTERVFNQTRTFTTNLTQSFTAQTRVVLPVTFIANGKPSYLRIVTTGTGKGMFGFSSWSGGVGGAKQYNDIVDTSTGVTGLDGVITQRDILFPPGCLDLYFTPYVTGSFTVGMTVVQSL